MVERLRRPAPGAQQARLADTLRSEDSLEPLLQLPAYTLPWYSSSTHISLGQIKLYALVTLLCVSQYKADDVTLDLCNPPR